MRTREATRARLLATAEELFMGQGYAATTVDAVAQEAGFTTGAVDTSGIFAQSLSKARA